MTEQTDSKIISRRAFLKGAAILGGAALAGVTPPTISRATPSPEMLPQVAPDTYTHNINGENLQFMEMIGKPTNRYINTDGSFFDLVSKKPVQPDQYTPDMILLGNTPAFSSGRDAAITPEFVKSPIIENIIKKGNTNLDKWINVLSKQTGNTNISTEFSKNNSEFIPTETNRVNFTPTPLLKMMQFNNAISDVLNYDRYSPEEFAKLSLITRLKAGYTNCQEFCLATAVVFAGAPLEIPTEIIKIKYKLPNSETILSHVTGIANYNNTPTVIDTTILGNDLLTLSDYFRNFSKNGITITHPIEFTSIISADSYSPFPWHDREWVNATTSLSIRAAYDPSFADNN